MKQIFLGFIFLLLGIASLVARLYYSWLASVINRETLGEISYGMLACTFSYLSIALFAVGLFLLPYALSKFNRIHGLAAMQDSLYAAASSKTH